MKVKSLNRSKDFLTIGTKIRCGRKSFHLPRDFFKMKKREKKISSKYLNVISPELGYCVAPHLSFVQFLSRAEHRWECCALEEERDVEPSRLCGRDCIFGKWEGWAGQAAAKRQSNVVEPCGGETEAAKGAFFL